MGIPDPEPTAPPIVDVIPEQYNRGTGATDNAAGVAVVMEAMRILKSLNLPMARTVRAAFWNAGDMGTRGSRAYVRIHNGELNKIILLH